MIQEIVDHLNDVSLDLDFLKDKHGLAERITKVAQDNEGGQTTRIYPAEYCGKGEYKSLFEIDKKQGLSYHRLIGTVTSSEGDDNAVGCDMQIIKEYPLLLVAYVKKSLIDDFQYSDIQLAETISNVISSSNVKALMGTFNADTITIVPTAYIVDREVIWAQETEGLGMRINFDYSYVAVNYTATVTADVSCFVNLCDPVNQAYAT